MPKGVQISSSVSEYTVVDEVEAMLKRLGNLGQFGDPPSANLARSVYWASPAGAGTKDGSSATNAIATADAGHNLMSANQDDVLVCLPGDYSNELITSDLAGVHILAFGLGQCEGVRIVMSADHVELAGFVIDYSTGNAHGIQISTANYFWIHHNIIKDIAGAYDAIDKSAGGNVEGGIIEKNIITNCPAGIGTVDFIENTIRDNWIFKNTAEGIILGSGCDNNLIENNKVFENDEGIEVQGDSNYLSENIVKGNTTRDIVDAGTTNRWVDTKGAIHSGTWLRTNAHGVTEQDVVTNVDVPRAGKISIECDVSDFSDGGLITLRAENTAGDVLVRDTFLVGTDEEMCRLEFWIDSGNSKFDLTIQTSEAVLANRTMNYEIIFGDG